MILTISLVTFRPDLSQLAATLASLHAAVCHAQACSGLASARLTLIDNGNDAGLGEVARGAGWSEHELVSGQGNLGFGRGHNLAFSQGLGDFHLVLNPDVHIEPDALSEALAFMQAHPDCALLSPALRDGDGRRHFLCKRYPTLLDLALRGFFPGVGRRFFADRLARYELAEHDADDVLWDPPIASGCFMLFRSSVLQELKGFDPDFFLYFEDFDLSLRTASRGRIAAVGAVRIEHFGGNAGRKGWAHVRMFAVSAWRFFSKHGWRVI